LQALPEKWRCKICKFANPTFEEDNDEKEESKNSMKTLVQKCKRCREPK